MKPKHLVSLLLILLTFMFGSLKAQCFKNVEFKAIQYESAIELKFDSDYENITVNLENVLLQGNEVFENTVRLESVIRGRKYIVFKDLTPSKYLIQLVTKDCKWVIGGIEGIIIKDEDEK